jgi:hypothetical protein
MKNIPMACTGVKAGALLDLLRPEIAIFFSTVLDENTDGSASSDDSDSSEESDSEEEQMPAGGRSKDRGRGRGSGRSRGRGRGRGRGDSAPRGKVVVKRNAEMQQLIFCVF